MYLIPLVEQVEGYSCLLFPEYDGDSEVLVILFHFYIIHHL